MLVLSESRNSCLRHIHPGVEQAGQANGAFMVPIVRVAGKNSGKDGIERPAMFNPAMRPGHFVAKDRVSLQPRGQRAASRGHILDALPSADLGDPGRHSNWPFGRQVLGPCPKVVVLLAGHPPRYRIARKPFVTSDADSTPLTSAAAAREINHVFNPSAEGWSARGKARQEFGHVAAGDFHNRVAGSRTHERQRSLL